MSLVRITVTLEPLENRAEEDFLAVADALVDDLTSSDLVAGNFTVVSDDVEEVAR